MVKRKRPERKAIKVDSEREILTEKIGISSDDAADEESGSGKEDLANETDESDFQDMAKEEDIPITENEKASKRVRPIHLADELRNLQEGIQLFKSNIFKLQIDELLQELKLKDSNFHSLDKLLFKLKDVIAEIEPSEDFTVGEAEKTMKLSGICIPFSEPRPTASTQYKFKYDKPSDFNLGGPYILKTAIKNPLGFSVDLLVNMPKSLFSEKDYVNFRYFHKRAFYIAYIAKNLSSTDLPVNLSYEFLDGDCLRPILRLDPKKVDSSDLDFHKLKCHIRILPSIEVDTFNVTKLAPSRNCIRYNLANGESELKPTPFYNNSLLAEMQYFPNTVFLHKASKSCSGFVDACKLGQIWLKQRRFSSSIDEGGFGSWEWSLLIASLLQGGGTNGSSILSNGLSSYQLFKAVVAYIANNDLISSPFILVKESSISKNMDIPLLVNNSIGLNILWRMSPSDYSRLRHEATVTNSSLDDLNGDHFDSVFLEKVDSSIYQYDISSFIKIPRPSLDKSFKESERILYPSYKAYFSGKVFKILKEGLAERASVISTHYSYTKKFPLSATKPSDESGVLTVGLILNAELCERQVIHGPSAEDKEEAEKFRRFWGHKSELRRFRDGSIIESVVWQTHPSRTIVSQIITYLMERYFGENVAKEMQFSISGLASLFSSDENLGKVNAFTSFQKNLDEFESLRKILVEIDDLPLRVSSVLPVSPRLRYSSVELPTPFHIDSSNCFSDVLIELETSSRWPDDLVAIQHSKTAFLIAIADSLRSEDSSFICNIGLEEHLDSIRNFSFLDILLPSGFAFRVRIVTDREIGLLNRYKANKDFALQTINSVKRNLTVASRHTSEFQTLVHRFAYLSPTVRRVKKWFASHLLSTHIDDILIELLVLAAFLNPYPWTVPSNSNLGFLRVLYFLSNWDWRDEPLILDTNSSLTIADIQEIRNSFRIIRKNDPDMKNVAMFVATPYDKSGILWTSNRPSKVIAARITSLARASCIALKSSGTNMNFKKLFVSPLKDFDFIIHLKSTTLATGGENASDLLMYSDSICDYYRYYFNELQTVFSESALFFYDSIDKKIITGLWNPQITKNRSFKVYMGFSSQPGDDGQVQANIKSMLKEMERLGGDLVVSITERNI
ncbi:Nrap protein [Dipodascopsis uninucleata]